MKIVLIGPVYPFVGGISHYTGILSRALAEKHDVHVISFKMMYPKFLHRKAQRDYSDDTFKIDNAEFLINTANPLNIIKVAGHINKIAPDIVLLQWWHPYFAPCYRILLNHLNKKIRIYFTCHNVFPHERFPLDKFLTMLVLKHGDGFIIHSKRDEQDLISVKKSANYKFNPHPTYNAFKMRNLSVDEARNEIAEKDGFSIDNNTKILLFFGFVREYKGLRYAIEAMPKIISRNPYVRLLVVGSFDKNKDEYIDLINKLNIGEYIYLKDTYTPDSEVEKYFEASDLIVLPYVDATQSGIVQIAFGFEKPCLVTEVGGLPDVVTNGKTGYVVPSQDAKAISEAVINHFNGTEAESMQANIQAEAYKFSWEKMVESIEEL